MSIFPTTIVEPLVTIHTLSSESVGPYFLNANNASFAGLTSNSWSTSNQAYFIPFIVTKPIVAVFMFVHNGASVSGNIDIGIYSADLTKLVSAGTTAQAGTSALQTFDIADTKLAPGLFYLAAAMNNTTGTTQSIFPSGTLQQQSGVFKMSSAFPLPATATVASMGGENIPLIGLSTRTVI